MRFWWRHAITNRRRMGNESLADAPRHTRKARDIDPQLRPQSQDWRRLKVSRSFDEPAALFPCNFKSPIIRSLARSPRSLLFPFSPVSRKSSPPPSPRSSLFAALRLSSGNNKRNSFKIHERPRSKVPFEIRPFKRRGQLRDSAISKSDSTRAPWEFREFSSIRKPVSLATKVRGTTLRVVAACRPTVRFECRERAFGSTRQSQTRNVFNYSGRSRISCWPRVVLSPPGSESGLRARRFRTLTFAYLVPPRGKGFP